MYVPMRPNFLTLTTPGFGSPAFFPAHSGLTPLEFLRARARFVNSGPYAKEIDNCRQLAYAFRHTVDGNLMRVGPKWAQTTMHTDANITIGNSRFPQDAFETRLVSLGNGAQAELSLNLSQLSEGSGSHRINAVTIGENVYYADAGARDIFAFHNAFRIPALWKAAFQYAWLFKPRR